jgi:hypothetical protein
MKKFCIRGRPKSAHYVVTVRPKKRMFHDCKKFREAPRTPRAQLILNIPAGDRPQ